MEAMIVQIMSRPYAGFFMEITTLLSYSLTEKHSWPQLDLLHSLALPILFHRVLHKKSLATGTTLP